MSDVRAFGAKGNGVADDAPAIQHAVEKAGDGLLEFPLGNYRLSRTIEVKLTQLAYVNLVHPNLTDLGLEGANDRTIGQHFIGIGPAVDRKQFVNWNV